MKTFIKIGAALGTLATLVIVLGVHIVLKFMRELDRSAEDVSDWWDDTFGDYEWDDDWVDGGWSEHHDPA
jgi:hypothetical protein